MGELESFLHDTSPIPPLLRCGLIHVQFETVHPYLDGNGRMGRLLISLWLSWKRILQRPLLYLSEYFKRHRGEYYDRLQQVREAGDWEGWMRFFLEGVRLVATEAAESAGRIQEMREGHQHLMQDQTGGHAILDRLLETPMITVNQVRDLIGKTYPVAAELVRFMEEKGLLLEMTGRSRNRVFAYRPYLALLGEEAGTLPELALRFVLSRPEVSTVIPGMRRPEHARANAAVSDGRVLSPELLRRLEHHAWEKNWY